MIIHHSTVTARVLGLTDTSSSAKWLSHSKPSKLLQNYLVTPVETMVLDVLHIQLFKKTAVLWLCVPDLHPITELVPGGAGLQLGCTYCLGMNIQNIWKILKLQAGFWQVLFLENNLSSSNAACKSYQNRAAYRRGTSQQVPLPPLQMKKKKKHWRALTPMGCATPWAGLGSNREPRMPFQMQGSSKSLVYKLTLIKQHRSSGFRKTSPTASQQSASQQCKCSLSSEGSTAAYLQNHYEHMQWMSHPKRRTSATELWPDDSTALGRCWTPWAGRRPPQVSFISGKGEKFCHTVAVPERYWNQLCAQEEDQDTSTQVRKKKSKQGKAVSAPEETSIQSTKMCVLKPVPDQTATWWHHSFGERWHITTLQSQD